MKTIDERLKRLEKSTRRWQIFGFLAVSALVYSLIGGAEGKRNVEVPKSHANPILMDNIKFEVPDTLSIDQLFVKNISLRDSRGEERITLRVLEGGSPTIIMRDTAGRAKTYWTISADGQPQMAMMNDAGKEVALLAEHPKKDGGLMRISNNSEKVVSAITTDSEGNGMLSVTKSDGSRPIGLGYW